MRSFRFDRPSCNSCSFRVRLAQAKRRLNHDSHHAKEQSSHMFGPLLSAISSLTLKKMKVGGSPLRPLSSRKTKGAFAQGRSAPKWIEIHTAEDGCATR